MANISVVVKRVGEDAKQVKILNELVVMQNIVEGFIESVYLGNGIHLICNEEGKLESEPNFALGRDIIFGNVIFVGSDGEDFTSLNENQVSLLKRSGLLQSS